METKYLCYIWKKSFVHFTGAVRWKTARATLIRLVAKYINDYNILNST